ncbi:dipeptidase [Bordetella petrii]|uniref:dipeptidase n=1 Tax=Bordetella petrii TaxID=94624 RepID=UPI001E5BA136|nr:membrane dipeptidase [Bordetella petrii]MCD0501443.1 membrane dipeptidase [Bordetella petrii]
MSKSTARRIVIDGLVFHGDGNPEPLHTGQVTAANITVAPYTQGFEPAFDAMSRWLAKVAQPDLGWRLVLRADDIEQAQAQGQTGLIMGWQNLLPLESRLERIRGFHAMGLRVGQLTYNEANFVADGCGEARGGGLTEFGHAVVAEMNAVGVAIDLSHCSEATVQQAAALSTKPVLLTHANAKSMHDRVRNKTDESIRAVAATGGVIGASIHGFLNWSGDPGQPPTLESFAAHVRHLGNLVGLEHVGIGTDFACVQDPAQVDAVLELSRNYPGPAGVFINAFGNRLADRYPKETPSPREFPAILQALEKAGFTGREIDGIAGGNFLRAFRAIWG